MAFTTWVLKLSRVSYGAGTGADLFPHARGEVGDWVTGDEYEDGDVLGTLWKIHSWTLKITSF